MIVLNHYTVDIINLVGILLGILGFFYLTYELFGRKKLTWFIRVITPGMLSAVILASIGALGYIFVVPHASLPDIFRSGILYALVGGIIGIFNGLFLLWPLGERRPRVFSWQAALTGMAVVFTAGLLLTSIYSIPARQRALQQFWLASLGPPTVGIWLAPLGALIAGFWRFFNWAEPAQPGREPAFSWRWCASGSVLTFVLGLPGSLALGRPLSSALAFALALIPTGAIAGGLWQFALREPLPKSPSEENIGNAPTEKLADRKRRLAMPKAPLFSARGCLIGMISAFFFAFVLALISDLFYLLGPLAPNAALIFSARAAFTAASLAAPVGALTGGLSRFIFWRVNALEEGQLGGIGAALTLLGFVVQLLPSLLDYFNFPSQ